ncbi:MAG: c-type cytochrome, partial [Candidatus Rokuibacteriota bacterium]
AQHSQSGHGQEAVGTAVPTSPTSGAPGARLPRRVTMEELHRAGGVPRGWKFTVPPGDPAKGRQLFADLECYKCHVVKGELLPAAGDEPKSSGPELTGMGAEHPAEYIAESILAPNHVIVDGPGYSGPDGLSTMPSFVDSLSLAQWLDLSAYLKSLTGEADAPHAAHEIEREHVARDYRIRVVYLPPASPTGHHGAGGHSHPGGHGSAGTKPKLKPGRLSVFVTDREFDEPVPYLPVTAAVQAERRPTERLRLGPRMGEQGFHYGLDVTLPPRTQKITLSIGPTTVQLAKGKFTQAVSAVFEWEPAPR